jgi:Fic-DOC domain mobile mystery protein B
MNFEYAIGATPLDPDEIDGLIPIHITTQDQLNEWEYNNILKAEYWLNSRTQHGDILTIDFVKLLHRKMLSDTWKWAGKFRLTERNIGVVPYMIANDLHILLEDVRYQIKNQSIPLDEIAYRFHHRLVSIHPFPNENGRHARMITDLLLIQTGETRFTWGKQKLEAEGPMRTRYINALKSADKQDYSPLAEFVRS